MSTSSVPTVLDALRAALAAYTGLTSVNVWSAPQGDYQGENIVLASDEVTVTEEGMGIGSTSRDESYSIPCSVWVGYPNSEETDIKACRDRAYALLGYVEAYLNDAVPQTVSSTCRSAEVGGHSLKQAPFVAEYNGRICQIDFTIAVEAAKVP